LQNTVAGNINVFYFAPEMQNNVQKTELPCRQPTSGCCCCCWDSWISLV